MVNDYLCIWGLWCVLTGVIPNQSRHMAGAKDAHNCAIELGLPLTIATMIFRGLSPKQRISHIKRLYDLLRD